MNVILPPLFRVAEKERGNSIRQLIVPSWIGDATVEPLETGRMRGFTIKRTDGMPPILLLTNGAQPHSDWSYALRLRSSSPVDVAATELDLSGADWLRHPDDQPPLRDLASYEANVWATRASWLGAFAYKREDSGRNIEGLRPPQIGAIYAVQAHWTVNSDPATIVLPTGVGKTETMISLLVAEQCQRLLVVVPTDALRTQLAEKFLTLGLLKTPRFGVVAEHALYPVVECQPTR